MVKPTPLKKYARPKWVHLPQIGMKIKNPLPSMYGIFTYIWLIFIVNVGRYDIPYMDAMGIFETTYPGRDRLQPPSTSQRRLGGLVRTHGDLNPQTLR